MDFQQHPLRSRVLAELHARPFAPLSPPTRILHFAGPSKAPDAIERLRGWREELAANRLQAVEPPHGDWSAASGFELGQKIDVAIGMETSGSKVPFEKSRWAADNTIAIRGYELRAPDAKAEK